MNNNLLNLYFTLLGPAAIHQLEQTAAVLKGIKIVNVSSTREGGGVAEILNKMVPLTNALGIETRWEIIKGNNDFFQTTKRFHNLLQGMNETPPTEFEFKNYEEVNEQNAEVLRPILEEADVVIVHDPQPLSIIRHVPKRKGKWVWRCHIDVSSAPTKLWNYLKKFISKYDASVFSLEDFARPLPHPIYLIPPSIDPLSEKNIEIDEQEVHALYHNYNIDIERPRILQVSRFDHFKDPVGVIYAYRMAKRYFPSLQLILAGGGASDDPEAEKVLSDVQKARDNDPDVFVLFLPPDPRAINCFQRGADIVIQKSIKEGFGLTITEALWKSKPVIGGNTGGIRLQVFDHYTGFLVNTPEGAALRIRHLLQNPHLRNEFGNCGKQLVKDNFLITRHLQEYLTAVISLLFPRGDRIDLG